MSFKTELGGTCSLCYNPLDTCAGNVLIDENILELCTFLIPTLDTYVLHGSPVCENCLGKIHEAYNFKALRHETLKLDVKQINDPEFDVTSRNIICIVCRNVLNKYSCAPLMPLIEENDIKDTILYLVSEKEFKSIENPQSCADCQNIVLSLCDILTLLSIYELRSQAFNVDFAEKKFKIPECENLNQLSIKNEFEPMNINYDCAIPPTNNDFEIKREAMEPVPSTSKAVPEAVAGSSSYDVYKCKNEEVDLKMEQDEPPSDTESTEKELCLSSVKGIYKIIRYPGCHIYLCLTCGYNTKEQMSITNHLVIHSVSEINYNLTKCLLCASVFKDTKGVVEHMKDNHQNPKEIQPIKCPFCIYQTIEEKTFVQHLKDHKFSHEIEIFKCEICNFKSTEQSEIEHHSLSHKKPKVADWYICSECTFETKYTFYLAKHLKERHRHTCQFCTFTTPYDNTLREHEDAHKSQHKKRIIELKKERIMEIKKEKMKLKEERMAQKKQEKADEMAKITIHKAKMIRFVKKTMAQMKKGKMMQLETEKIPTNKERIKLKKMKVNTQRSYQCLHCGVILKSLDIMRSHTEEFHRLYQCTKCDFNETKQDLLTRHIMKEHVPINCQICLFEVCNVAELKNHHNIHHKNSDNCSGCDFKAAIKESLINQMCKKHNVYDCPICHLQTEIYNKMHKKSSYCLNKDKNISEKFYSLKCSYCYYVTDEISLLEKHMSSHETSLCPQEPSSSIEKEHKKRLYKKRKNHSERFQSHSTKKKHIEHSYSSEKEFRCSKCDFKEAKQESLWRHIMREHVPINCQICEIKVNSLNDLQNHNHIHHHDSHNCSGCDFKAARTESLNHQMCKNHGVYDCSMCPLGNELHNEIHKEHAYSTQDIVS